MLARFLHIRRSLLRRFTNMSVLRPSSITVHPSLQPLLQKTYWNLLSGAACNLILFSNAFYGIFSDVDRNAANGHQYKRISPLGRITPPRGHECRPCLSSTVVINQRQDDVGPAE